MSKGARRFEIFTGAGRRREWSAAEKAAIVAESYAEDDTVCGVARRHGLSAQQVFTWRRLARRQHGVSSEPALFVPVVVEAGVDQPRAGSSRLSRPRRRRAIDGIELEFDGVVVRIGRDAEAGSIAAVVRALKPTP